jgi:predicted xylose isomerase-like sugar epimerase
MVELVRRFRKKKNVMPRTKKRLQNEADIKMLLQKKFKGVASRKMRLEAMVKTGLGERSVKNKIKKIRSLEST